MKTDSELLNIFYYDTSNCTIARLTRNLPTLTTEEIERLIQVVVKHHQIYTIESVICDYLLQAIQELSDRKIEECTTQHVTIEQLEIFGIPSGQCDHFGNDLY